MQALTDYWQHSPPAHICARLTAQGMGAKFDSKPVQKAVTAPTELSEAAVQALAGAGFTTLSGRPKDPMLDLLLETL